MLRRAPGRACRPSAASPSPSRTSGSRARSSTRGRSSGSRVRRRPSSLQQLRGAGQRQHADGLAVVAEHEQPVGAALEQQRDGVPDRGGARRVARASCTGTGSRSTSPTRRSASRRSARSSPMNSATKSSAGWARIASGVSYWASTPPGRRIAIRSPIMIASSMSWVTKITVFATSRCRRRSSSCRRARVIGSSAPNGSSISSTGGSAASARASPTRWRWPPGQLGRIAPGVARLEPDQVEELGDPVVRPRLRPAEQPRDGRHVVADRHVREEADLLDHVPDPASQLDDGQVADAAAVDPDVALVEGDRAGSRA